tara:strand:- start:57769 stop:59877 length:2109 start_codon:yes stop_codon:yes gene_type:complete
MSIVRKKYRQSFLEEIFLRYLHRNKVPSPSVLSREYTQLTNKYPLLTQQPYSRSLRTTFDRHESLSPEKYNGFWRRMYKDYLVLYNSLSETLQKVMYVGQSWDLFYSRINGFMDRVEDRIDHLLLAKGATLGYFEYIRDDFTTNEFVNTTESTVELDTHRKIVILPTVVGANKGTLARVSVDASAVTITTQINHPALLSKGVPGSVSSSNIVDDKNKPWYSVVTTSANSPSVNADIIVDLGSTYIFNSITANPCHASTRSRLLIAMFYSADKSDWIKAGNIHAQSIGDSGTWTFNEVEARYIRLLVSKPTIDQTLSSGNFVWTIGFNSIELYHSTYASEDNILASAVMRTGSLSIGENMDGTKNGFNRVKLSACELIEKGSTDILYEVSTDNTNWIPIGNSDRRNEGVPSVVTFGDERDVYSINTGDTYFVDRDTDKTFYIGDTAVYKSLAPLTSLYSKTVNLYIPESHANQVDYNTIRLWRNVGVKGSSFTVRDNPAGWYFGTDDAIIKTDILVTNPHGLDIDFGPNGIYLNNTKQTNLVHIPFGAHSIKTNLSNYAEITGGLLESELATVDSLYPYNHKYLIEGYVYPEGDTDTETGVYKGVNLFAEKLVTYVPVYRYNVTEELDLNIFTLDSQSSGELSGALQFFAMADISINDYENERFEINYLLKDQTFTKLYMRATLTTMDISKTPILKDYTLKVS